MNKGDYVLATKYDDGDPQDHWCVGFFDSVMDYETHERYNVVDGSGVPFRGNGFRRIKKISHERGKWLLDHKHLIEMSGRSVWYFARCKMDNMGGNNE